MIDYDVEGSIDLMLFSYSRLSSFYNCKHEWYLHYIEGRQGLDNFFSQFGSYMHKILEKYEKGELDFFDLVDYYTEHFSEEIYFDAPPNNYVDIKDSYYKKGLDYLENIDLVLEKYNVLGIEKKVEFELGGFPFVGFIDLLLEDKETKEITILDHKSASIKFLKNGNVAKGDKEHVEDFKRQLYLYSIPVLEEYGRVNFLEWNLFKDRNHYRIPWNGTEFESAKEWALSTIDLQKSERDWEPKQDLFYCKYLCGMREECEYTV